MALVEHALHQGNLGRRSDLISPVLAIHEEGGRHPLGFEQVQ